jgi:hypothetical protein
MSFLDETYLFRFFVVENNKFRLDTNEHKN